MKTDVPYLKHILQAIARIDQYTAGMTWAEFQKNPLVQDGVIRQIEIIGEAAKSVSAGLKEKHPELPWGKMSGMRDKLIHGYFGVDINSVWRTAVIDIPHLNGQIQQILDAMD